MEETMGKRISANRKALKLTQDQMAEQLGVTAQAVSKWENDQSCPDIAMIPKIAALFGITTDELLGVRPPEVHQGLVEQTPEPEIPEEGRHWDLEWEPDQKGSVGLGIWVLASGMLLLAARLLHWPAGFWDILWPTGMMVFGIWGVVRVNDGKPLRFSFLRLTLVLLGAYYLLNNIGLLPVYLNRDLLLPICLVLFGLSLLVDTLGKKHGRGFRIRHNGKAAPREEFFQEEDSFRVTASFGGSSRIITLPQVRRGAMEVSFGELTVDLTRCALADGCRLDAQCSFGELTILLPPDCLVESDAGQSFGAVEFRGSPQPGAASRVRLSGDASFGQITVEYL